MDPSRFDAVSRLFASRRLTRCRALAQGGTGLAAGALAVAGLARSVHGQDATPAPGSETLPASETTYLFVQSFESGSLAAKEGEAGRYTVTLDHGLGQTIYFSDRPERIVGAVPTEKFLDYLGFTPENPPNAALIVHRGPDETDIAVVELFDPVYDAANANATYDVQVLAEWESAVDMAFAETAADLAALAPDFGAAHLFIDSLGECPVATMQCYAPGTSPATGAAPVGELSYGGGFCAPAADAGACFPCEHPTPTYWADQCNQQFAACNGDCGLWNFCSRDAFVSSHTNCTNSDAGGTWIGW